MCVRTARTLTPARTRPSWAADATLTEPMSMREFSRLIRRSPSHISRVMNGKRASATISRLMKTLGVEVA